MTDPPLRLHSTDFHHPIHQRFFFPTSGRARYRSLDSKGASNHSSAPHQVEESLNYHSRRARKGRYALKTRRIQHHHREGFVDKPSTEHAAGEVTVRLRIRTTAGRSNFKPHLKLDVSFWLAATFLLGSLVWVANGFTVLLPLYLGSIKESEQLTTTYFEAAAALAFLGGAIFEVGSWLMVVEALNRGRETGFGTAVVQLLQSGHPTRGLRCEQNSSSFGGEKGDVGNSGMRRFVWWAKPMWRDLGYDAALVQWFAATVFWVSTITGLPGVIPGFPPSGSHTIIDLFFWTPQVVGGTGFIVSSLLLMIEVQHRWWLPNLGDLGWHIGFWNLVGSVGFMLCGAMGYSRDERWVMNSAICTLWGSCAFLIGSIAQMYEAVWREPEEEDVL